MCTKGNLRYLIVNNIKTSGVFSGEVSGPSLPRIEKIIYTTELKYKYNIYIYKFP